MTQTATEPVSETATETQSFIYIYCVVRSDAPAAALDVPAIGGQSRVRPIRHKGLTAIVSDTDAERTAFRRANIRGHEAVVDAALESGDALPARFGHILPNTDLLVRRLDEHRTELERELDRVHGRVEMGVKASWADLRGIYSEIVAGDKTLRTLRSRMKEHATRKTQMAVGERMEKLVEALRTREADELVDAVRPHAVPDGVAVNDNLGAELAEQAMVVNSSFLVERSQVEDFSDAVAALDAARDDRFTIVVAGPLPPYNFVSIDTKLKAKRAPASSREDSPGQEVE